MPEEERKTSHYVQLRQMKLRSEMSTVSEHTADRIMIITISKLFILRDGFCFS